MHMHPPPEKKFHSETSKRGRKVPHRYVGKKECRCDKMKMKMVRRKEEKNIRKEIKEIKKEDGHLSFIK